MSALKKLFASAFILLVALQCKTDKKSYMPNVTGLAGELVVVMNDKYWDSGPGEITRAILADEMVGLPQDEPLFDVIHVNHGGFGEMLRTTRNLVITYFGDNDSSGVFFNSDYWAKTQALCSIYAKDSIEYTNLVSSNSSKILSYFIKAERNRLISRYKKVVDQNEMQRLKEHLGVEMIIPSGYTYNKSGDKMAWISHETPMMSLGLIVYTYPYTNENQFNKENLIRHRNNILKNHIPGPTEGTYMTTEEDFPIVSGQFEINGNYAVELRGLWKLENGFMGGPFVSITQLDEENNRIITAEGYVYAPRSEDKRNLVRRLEAIIHTLKIPSKNTDGESES